MTHSWLLYNYSPVITSAFKWTQVHSATSFLLVCTKSDQRPEPKKGNPNKITHHSIYLTSDWNSRHVGKAGTEEIQDDL